MRLFFLPVLAWVLVGGSLRAPRGACLTYLAVCLAAQVNEAKSAGMLLIVLVPYMGCLDVIRLEARCNVE